MKRRMRRRNPGQSIVLIALIIAVLIGLVALSVDVGNAYAQQRAAQRATDAAVTDAMRVAVIPNATNRDVRQAMMDSLTEHNIVFDKNLINVKGSVPVGSRGIEMTYFLDDQREIPVPDDDVERPRNMRYIKLDILGSERTNFASLFGRDDLAVRGRSYAAHSICAPFPIGIDDAAFGPTGDRRVQFEYTDNNLRKKPGRRVFLRDDVGNTVNGKFAWLRWLPSTGTLTPQAAVAQALLSTFGTPEFKEADWPAGVGGKTNAYPNLPEVISESDWVLGTVPMKLPRAFTQAGALAPLYEYTGNDASSADQISIADRLEWHIKNRSVINLPVYVKKTSGFGADARFQIDRFEGFLITGYGYDQHDQIPPLGNDDAALGGGWYLDIVRIGRVQECVNLTAGGNVTQPLTLRGSVKINPVYQLGKSPNRDPIDIVVVLDASGSMNWTWDGRGILSGDRADELAYKTDNANPPVPFLSNKYQPDGVGASSPFFCGYPDVLALDKPCQSADAWNVSQERRLYKAKTAIAGFLNGFPWQSYDRAAVVTYSGFAYVKAKTGTTTPSGSTANLAKSYPGYPGFGDMSKNITGPGGVTDLLINSAATLDGDLYKTLGASPGYHGLKRAHDLLQKAPLDSPTGKRRRVVIFLTDGLLNVDMNGGKSAQETIDANIGDSTKPINQAITEAEAIRADQSHAAAVYVIAMGVGYEQAGLAAMATEPGTPYFQSSQDPDAMDNMLKAIEVKVTTGTCEEREVGYVIPDPGSAVDASKAPLPSPKIGYVEVLNDASTKIGDYDIAIDQNNNATFNVPNLQPGSNYKLRFWIYYKSLDGETRLYSTIMTSGVPQDIKSVQMERTGVSLVQTLPLQLLRFSGSAVCPKSVALTPTP